MTSQLNDFLGDNSSLTRTQIRRLMVQLSLQNPGQLVPGGENGSEITGVTPGAYYRVLSQAKNNVNEALYTLLLCTRIGVINIDDLRRLLDLITKIPPDVAGLETNEVISLVGALVRKIVML